MTLTERIHGAYVYDRRVNVLAHHLAELLPREARVLDVGSGDGLLARRTLDLRSDLHIEGLDVLQREHSHIPVKLFDGRSLPFDDGAFDVVQFIDVLHHTDHARQLLREAVRVTRQTLLIKDHTATGIMARVTLRFMDIVGNARFGVNLPHNYWRESEWRGVFDELGLCVDQWRSDLRLYPWWADWCFGRRLHFIAVLTKVAGEA